MIISGIVRSLAGTAAQRLDGDGGGLHCDEHEVLEQRVTHLISNHREGDLHASQERRPHRLCRRVPSTLMEQSGAALHLRLQPWELLQLQKHLLELLPISEVHRLQPRQRHAPLLEELLAPRMVSTAAPSVL